MKPSTHKLRAIMLLLAVLPLSATAQDSATAEADTLKEQQLAGLTVTARRSGTRRMGGAVNGVSIGREELFRAACCNLGESFTTNPSVDVSYSDAATGAKQIRLLGLSGTYVQMLTENLPNYRGAAAPYALDYVPGPWMKSIQVSKGASSVRNGYESITGQIDVEYLKPDDDEGVTANIYGNSLSRLEANADGNIHIDNHLSTELLLHWQDDYGHHDENHDGFLDQPNVRQWNLQNRWKWRGDRYIFHGGLSLIKEKREGGQTHPQPLQTPPQPLPVREGSGYSQAGRTAEKLSAPLPHREGLGEGLFRIAIETDRYEGYMKHAFIINPEQGTNIALMATLSMQQLGALYGHKQYDVNEKNAYAQLMFETNFTTRHNLSAGLSLNHDYLSEELRVKSEELSLKSEELRVKSEEFATARVAPLPGAVANSSLFTLHSSLPKETTSGLYAQYTYTLGTRLTAMAGLRADHSSHYGTFFTPRLHVKYAPTEAVSLRLSAGKGYRSPHALAENHYLLASGRRLVIDDLQQESAWNYGVSSSFNITLLGKTLKLNAEYYHTRFLQQTVIDYDSDPTLIHITNLDGRSYSNTLQIDATYPVAEGLELTAAYRWNDVKTTYGGTLMEKPLTSRYKGLLTTSYKTPLGLWQIDATLQLNGGGRTYTSERFSAYEQLSLQVTRWFRHWSVYIGAENLTGRRQHQTIIGADDPWADTFEPTMVWGPVHGRVAYAGLRINIGRM